MAKRKLLSEPLGIMSPMDDLLNADNMRFWDGGAIITPSIRRFCKEIGVAKADSMVEVVFVTHCLREERINRYCTRNGRASPVEG